MTESESGPGLPESLVERVESALRRRDRLLNDPNTTAARLIHGAADDLPGLVVERFGEVLVVQLHEGRLDLSEQEVRAIAAYLQGRLGCRAVYRKVFVKDRAGAIEAVDPMQRDERPWLGEAVAPEIEITENGLRFLIRPYDGFSVGLFLEHRDHRRKVRAWSQGKRVLNTFAYTCGFSVAAAAGGAIAVDSVDSSKRYLEWGKRHFALNGLPLESHTFFCSDVFDFYQRARRQRRSYDLIILDPPTFSRQRRPRRVFVLGEQLDRLCAEAIDLLEPHGQILLATNDRSIDLERMRDAVTGVRNRRQVHITPLALPDDFAGDAAYARAISATFDQPEAAGPVG